jgi:arylsulfatase A-like enzyme
LCVFKHLPRASVALALVVALVAGVVGIALVVERSRARSTATARPNLVLIVTDDQRWDTLWAMPNVRSLLARHGVTFSHAVVSTSNCCPSRATLLSGEYSHHTGVLSDALPYAAPSFDARSTLATWLHDAGYRTALVGKYLNRYDLLSPRIPPGWDQWDAISSRSITQYYHYDLNQDGTIHHYGVQADDYSTTVLGRLALGFVTKTPSPFFLYFAPIAPHLPSSPAPGDGQVFARLPDVSTPAFNEPDVSDKPWGPATQPLDPDQVAYVNRIRRHALDSLLAVDRFIATLVHALAARGTLGRTIIAFTSDNGFLFGEHRLVGKVWPYDESIRVPLVVRTPWIGAPGRVDDHLVSNVDLAATLTQLAAVQPGLPQDGHSLVPFLGSRASSTPWTNEALIEDLEPQEARGPPPFVGIRTDAYLYVRYRNGWRELYDLRTDPYEQRNLAGLASTARLQDSLWADVERLYRPGAPFTVIRSTPTSAR